MNRLAAVLILLSTSACATAPKVGVRHEFEKERVATIAVAPLHASSHFGLDEKSWETLERRYLDVAVEQLQSLGFRVIPPDELRADLRKTDSWLPFLDVLDFRRDLAVYFEPDLYNVAPREVVLLTALSDEGKLPTHAVLVSEIVYQSEGLCTSDARDHNQHAEVWVENVEASGSIAESPCVVSHFQAKLVDARTGKTMWHNRLLREVRVATLSMDARLDNIEATVAGTLGGTHGVAAFSPHQAPIAGK